MNILTPSGAKHFCSGFSSAQTTALIDVRNYLGGRSKSFPEGTPRFDELRDCLIRESERYAFLSAAAYAASWRIVRASAASWAIVGFYYSAFFAAKSLLGMHGGWIDGPNRWLEVTNGNPSSLELTFKKTTHPLLTTLASGSSHKAFWTVFYSALRPLGPYVPAHTAFALQPVHSSETWLIDNRNNFNYSPNQALRLLWDFLARFDAHSMPSCFPGDLKVFSNIAVAMQQIVHDFRVAHNLAGDVFAGNYTDLRDAVDQLIRADRETDLDTYSARQIGTFSI